MCPGLNDVIRSLFLELHHAYGVKEVLGFRGGYQGLDPARGEEPIVLTPEFVDDIHKEGGTVLGTSRGPVDIGRAVDNLIRRGVNILFTIGGDGTQRGGNDLFQEAKRRGHALAVVGIPKTVDNDVAFVSRTFGYLTAVQEAAKVSAPRPHRGAQRPERHRPGQTDGPPRGVHRRRRHRGQPGRELHPGPGSALQAGGQARLPGRTRSSASSSGRTRWSSWPKGPGRTCWRPRQAERDASGNVKLKDIGLFLRERIEALFQGGEDSRGHALLRSELSRPQQPGQLPKTRSCATCSRATPSMPRWPARPAW